MFTMPIWAALFSAVMGRTSWLFALCLVPCGTHTAWSIPTLDACHIAVSKSLGLTFTCSAISMLGNLTSTSSARVEPANPFTLPCMQGY